jgi:hypothetical protein
MVDKKRDAIGEVVEAFIELRVRYPSTELFLVAEKG